MKRDIVDRINEYVDTKKLSSQLVPSTLIKKMGAFFRLTGMTSSFTNKKTRIGELKKQGLNDSEIDKVNNIIDTVSKRVALDALAKLAPKKDLQYPFITDEGDELPSTVPKEWYSQKELLQHDTNNGFWFIHSDFFEDEDTMGADGQKEYSAIVTYFEKNLRIELEKEIIKVFK